MMYTGEKLGILLLQGKIQYEHWESHKVLSPGRKVSNTAATELVAYLLGRKKDLVVEVWSDYFNGKPLYVANTKGDYCLKSTRVPRACSVTTIVQHFFQEWR